MPSVPKPKTWKAARGFYYSGHRYRIGDPVTGRRAIDHLLRYGDKYIVADRTKAAPAETTAAPNVDPATSSEEG